VLLLILVGAWTIIQTGSVKIVEAFMLANAWLFIILTAKKSFTSITEIADVVVAGTKNVMAALLIIALAYALNSVTTELGAGQFIIEQFTEGLSPNTLVIITFLLTAAISFSTGTSWGAYAMMIPVALPVRWSTRRLPRSLVAGYSVITRRRFPIRPSCRQSVRVVTISITSSHSCRTRYR